MAVTNNAVTLNTEYMHMNTGLHLSPVDSRQTKFQEAFFILPKCISPRYYSFCIFCFTASFMFGADPGFLPFALMIYGGVLALVFGLMKFLNLDLLQFALCALISFHIVMVTISGNFDVIFSQLFIKLLLIPIYGLMFVFMRQIFKYY